APIGPFVWCAVGAHRTPCSPKHLILCWSGSSSLTVNRPGCGEAAFGHWFVWLSSADSAKDRSVANVRCLVAFLQPLGHVTTDRQIRQMVRRPRYAPQFNRSLPYPLAILRARRLRRGCAGGHVAIKPVEKIPFDDRK